MKYIFLTLLTFSTHAFSCEKCLEKIEEDYFILEREYLDYAYVLWYANNECDVKSEFMRGKLESYKEVMTMFNECKNDLK